MKFTHILTGQEVEATTWQMALKAGDYYCIEGELMPTVYGHIITNEAEEGEPPYRPGFFLVRGYSEWCPQGELGMFCIVDATRPLSPEEFAQARANGWTGV